jgi:hypothetical protein
VSGTFGIGFGVERADEQSVTTDPKLSASRPAGLSKLRQDPSTVVLDIAGNPSFDHERSGADGETAPVTTEILAHDVALLSVVPSL